MPKKNHKGKPRHFTNFEELQSEESLQKEVAEAADEAADEPAAEGGEAESESGDDEGRHKGVSHLIDTVNPNRVPRKPKKASEIGQAADPESSRRKKEQSEADRLKIAAERRQVEADLARLAIIRKQREEEERRMAEAKKLKELKAQMAAAGSSSSSPTEKPSGKR